VKYVIGILAIAVALLLVVFVSKVLGIIVGVIAVLVLPWTPVWRYGSGAGDS
jgi:hypothetical protein